MDSMDRLTSYDLQTLMQTRAEHCLSLFMPTHRKGREVQQDPIRFKNLLREAEERLAAAGMRSAEARELLAPARNLGEGDGLFWQHQGDGLALYLAPRVFRYYRLPLAMDELVVVAERFHVKRLVPLVTDNAAFYVLALSQNVVRLFHNTRYHTREIDLGDTPRSLAEAMKYEDPEKQLQFHTGTQPSRGERAAVFHGQGAGADEEKNRIFRFLRQVDEGLHALLRDEKAPLVVAAVDYLQPIYVEANTYPHLAEAGVTGNPDDADGDELREQAWAILEPQFREQRNDAVDRFAQLASTERAADDVAQVVPAAHYGRVETLFVAVGQQQWGRFYPEEARVEVHEQPKPDDEDLLDLAAVNTLQNRGTVYAVAPDEVPGGKALAAILRY